ncbi:glycosyltransferase family 2 protein, partial [Patescibacteria group bacterium]|nr:glycosyltransferase family 2 protein [Patescibacteria group bacterium]
TMTQFLRKMDTYTTFQAELWRQSGVRWSAGNHWRYGLIRPLLRFGQKYLYLQGFRDGFLGFFAGIMAAVSEFLAYVKVKVEDAE